MAKKEQTDTKVNRLLTESVQEKPKTEHKTNELTDKDIDKMIGQAKEVEKEFDKQIQPKATKEPWTPQIPISIDEDNHENTEPSHMRKIKDLLKRADKHPGKSKYEEQARQMLDSHREE